MKRIISLFILISSSANADLYQVYFTDQAEISSNGQYVDYVKIINTSSFTTYDGDLSGYYSQTFTPLDAAATAANPGETYASAAIHDQSSAPLTVLDFTGTNLKFRVNSGLGLDPVGTSSADNYTYDIVNTVDLSTGEITETILVASSQAEFDIATEAGYTVVLDSSDINRSTNGVSFTSFSSNITNKNGTTDVANDETKGGLIVEQISGVDGASIFRQEADGTVHIGENSIVLADESISNSGFDQIYSSSGTLELGNSSSHRTIVTGTLEIQDPSAPNHATTKRYVDSISAMSTAVASMPQAGFGETMLSVGTGYRDGQSALALGITSRPFETPVSFNVNAAYSNNASKPTYGAGLGWKF